MSIASSDLRPVATRSAWASAPAAAQHRLRARELRLLSVLATGAPMSAIANLLGVSDRTIRRRVRMICEELEVSTPIEAVAWAARRRLI